MVDQKSRHLLPCPWFNLPEGEKHQLQIPVVSGPDGTAVSLPLLVIRGTQEGRTLLVSGGIHGDEFEGPAAIWKIYQELSPAEISGTFVGVPVVNVPAFEAGRRMNYDYQDLARVFPGDTQGTTTERIAHAFTHHCIAHADYYCDLHSAGQFYEIMPLVGYGLAEGPTLDIQREMANCFGIPFVWGTTPLPGRTLSAAREWGIPAIYAELRGAGQCRTQDVQCYAYGIQQLLRRLDLVEQQAEAFTPELIVEDPRDNSGFLQIQHRASAGGFFYPDYSIGDHVTQGTQIGQILDVLGNCIDEVRCHQTGQIIFLRTFPRVQAGDALLNVLQTETVPSA